MVCSRNGRISRLLLLSLGISGSMGLGVALAQDPAPPTPPASPPAAETSREVQLEDRVRQLEALVEQMSGQLNRMQTAPAAQPAATVGSSAGPGGDGGTGNPGSPTPGTSAAGSNPSSGGSLAPGQGVPNTPGPSSKFNMPAVNRNDALVARFGPGFMLRTEDDEYVLQFHDLTQVDGRFYEQGGQNPVKDSFLIPRQWLMWSGRLTKPYEYFVSVAEGFDTLNILDVFLNINYDQRLQFRLGRFKTPFTYEFFNQPIQGVINPERSLFFNNFALNRSIGAMAWGQLFDKRMDYAVGVFNTNRNSFVDVADGKDVLGYVNFRPFLLADDTLFQFLNFGGSVEQGDQSGPTNPTTLRTQVPTSGTSVAGVPFLTFNNNVRLSGQHTLWSLHAAWYHNHFSIVGEWQAGFQDYAFANSMQYRTHLPIDSFYVQAGYFITGETVSNRNVVKPLRPFDLRKGKVGPGAIELATRYNTLTLGQQVFTAGLSDPNNWARSVYLTDVGVNWYWNQYIKVMLDWEHAGFGAPVLYNATNRQLTSDLFWFRFQIFF